MGHSWMDDYCLRCGREESRCVCEIEFIHGPAYGEPRASRMPAHLQPLDSAFIEALAKPVPAEALREKEGRR